MEVTAYANKPQWSCISVQQIMLTLNFHSFKRQLFLTYNIVFSFYSSPLKWNDQPFYDLCHIVMSSKLRKLFHHLTVRKLLLWLLEAQPVLHLQEILQMTSVWVKKWKILTFSHGICHCKTWCGFAVLKHSVLGNYLCNKCTSIPWVMSAAQRITWNTHRHNVSQITNHQISNAK